MAQLIGFLVAMYLCIYLPWKANERDESKKRKDMYDNLNKKYPTDLLIYTNEDDILLDIITKASSNDVVIDSIFTLNKSSLKVLSVTVLVKNIDVLDKFCKDLYNIGSVVKIERQMF